MMVPVIIQRHHRASCYWIPKGGKITARERTKKASLEKQFLKEDLKKGDAFKAGAWNSPGGMKTEGAVWPVVGDVAIKMGPGWTMGCFFKCKCTEALIHRRHGGELSIPSPQCGLTALHGDQSGVIS